MAAHSQVEFVSRELVSKWKPSQTQTESHAKCQHSAKHDNVEMNQGENIAFFVHSGAWH